MFFFLSLLDISMSCISGLCFECKPALRIEDGHLPAFKRKLIVTHRVSSVETKEVLPLLVFLTVTFHQMLCRLRLALPTRDSWWMQLSAHRHQVCFALKAHQCDSPQCANMHASSHPMPRTHTQPNKYCLPLLCHSTPKREAGIDRLHSSTWSIVSLSVRLLLPSRLRQKTRLSWAASDLPVELPLILKRIARNIKCSYGASHLVLFSDQSHRTPPPLRFPHWMLTARQADRCVLCMWLHITRVFPQQGALCPLPLICTASHSQQ